jgi:hypothetical protein
MLHALVPPHALGSLKRTHGSIRLYRRFSRTRAQGFHLRYNSKCVRQTRGQYKVKPTKAVASTAPTLLAVAPQKPKTVHDQFAYYATVPVMRGCPESSWSLIFSCISVVFLRPPLPPFTLNLSAGFICSSLFYLFSAYILFKSLPCHPMHLASYVSMCVCNNH